jgi:hypothetical protein
MFKSSVKHSPTYAVFMCRKFRPKSNLAHVGTECAHDEMCMYTQGSPVAIQIPTHWNQTGHSTTVPPPVLSPSSILLLPWSYYAVVPATKNSTRIKAMLCQFVKLLSSEVA